MFTINKLFAIQLMEKGYKPASDLDFDKVKMMGIAIVNDNPTAAVTAPATTQAVAAPVQTNEEASQAS